jgi:GT2 family glycosyltransferase/glycosyltransferase involved in cell wall biosynthesis
MNTIVTVVLGVILCTLVCAQDLSSLKSEYLDHVRALSHVPEGEREESIRNILSGLNVYQTENKVEHLEWSKSTSEAVVTGKKVCLVASSLEGMTLNSGIGTVYASLAELLNQNGNKVTILFAQNAEGAAFDGAVARYAASGIQLVALPVSKSTIDGPAMVKKSFEVYQYLKNSEFDLIQFPEWEGLGYYTLLAKKEGLAFASTTIVVGLHGPTHWVVAANTGKDELISQGDLELDYMERKSVELADSVWTPSQEVYAWAVEHGWKLSAPSLLPLPAGKVVKELGKVDKARKAKELVFFGRLEVRKGLKMFCDALDELSVSEDIIVTFLGSQSITTIEGLQAVEYIESRAANWKFFWKVVADTDRSDALQYLLDAEDRIAVIPSLVDNAPYTVYECLYLGIPFLASNIPSIASLVAGDSKNLFDRTPAALASAMKKAVEKGVPSAQPVWTVVDAENTWSTYYNSLLSVESVQSQNTETPKVSICLVHYNRPNLLLQAIESIEAQDYSNIEVVLVDDGSSMPEAVSLLEHLEAPFSSRGWKIIKTSNKYLGAARNTAAKAASGKFLFFLDDDNYLKVDTISTYVRVALKTQATLLTAAHAVFQGVEPPSDATVAERIWVPLGSSVAVGLFRNCYGDANFFVAREAFLAQQFTEETAVGFEDYEFHAKAALNGWESVVIPEPLLWYRMHDDGQMILSTSSLMNRLRSLRPYAAKLQDFKPLMRFLAR